MSILPNSLLLAALLATTTSVSAQMVSESDSNAYTILADDPILKGMDSLLNDPYLNYHALISDTTQLNKFGFAPEDVPVYNDSTLEARLNLLNGQTPFELTFNKKVKAFINLYAVKRRELTSRVLGLQAAYFPLFEELLSEFDLPLEFKYLAVVESALKPTARSRSGAVGLWQFMYRTGKIYGLQSTSYVDDRKDIYKSTVAACKYFQFLYKIYGNYELVMAAYNCGPGNVNKAIRRSGYKDGGYWELWPYLPRETRGYVPAFIAVNYVMNYAAEHNLYPKTPAFLAFEYDTVQVREEVYFTQISEAICISLDTLKFLNPVYKKDFIPFTGKPMTLYLPKNKVGDFITNEKGIYTYGETLNDSISEPTLITKDVRKTHIVRSGEYLGKIAAKYHVSVSDIKQWNSLRSTRIYKGQRLMVYVTTQVPTKTAINYSKKPTGTLYTVQKGDTLWDIANANGVSVKKIRSLNTNLNERNLKPGTKIVLASGS